MASGKSTVATVLRVLAVVSFFVAFIVLFFSSQKQESKKVSAAYNHWSGFEFCLVVDCIAFVYNLMVLFIPAGSQLWKTVVVVDVIVNMMVGVSLGSGWQTYRLIKEGNAHARWCSLCGVLPFFCSKVFGSLITSCFGFLISFVLIMSVLNVCVDPFLIAQ